MRPVALIFSLILAGCVPQTDLEKLKSMEIEASDFNSSLAAEYLGFGQSEAEQENQEIAEYFAGKGLKAAAGEAVVPETAEKGMESSHRLLLDLLSEDMKHVAPQNLARAQMLFDCWAWQARQPGKEIAPCKEEFDATVAELQPSAELFILGKDSVHKLTFDSGESVLGDAEMKKIEHVAKLVSRLKRYTIELTTFPHRRVAVQRELATLRLDTVRDALIANGVPKENIKVAKRGDSKAVYLSRDLADAVEMTVKTLGHGRKK